MICQLFTQWWQKLLCLHSPPIQPGLTLHMHYAGDGAVWGSAWFFFLIFIYLIQFILNTLINTSIFPNFFFIKIDL